MIADAKQVLITAYDQFFCNYGQSEMFSNDLALVDLVVNTQSVTNLKIML